MYKGKEEELLNLFFNEPTKHWHFEEIIKSVRISRPQAAYWLKSFAKKRWICRNKIKGKMPYYQGNHSHPAYQAKKKSFAVARLESSGFIRNLLAAPNVQTIAAFGSFIRGDWYKESDLDIFVYGDARGLKLEKYRKSLGRPIHLITCQDEQELSKFSQGILQDIIGGYTIKGDFTFMRKKHA